MGLEFDGVNGIIKNTTSDGDVTIKGNDGGSEISALTFDMSTAGKATFNNDIALGDSQKVIFGASEDLQIYHDGSHSFVKDAGQGNLKLCGDNLSLKNADDDEAYIDCVNDGAVIIYHDNSQKFTTTSSGVTIDAGLLINGATPSITIGDGGAEDTKLLFDGNAQNFYIGLDDSADDLLIGLGSTVGTTPAIAIDENNKVTLPDGQMEIIVSGNYANLTLTTTDADDNFGPELRLYRNSSSPANADNIGLIDFEGKDSIGDDELYARIASQINDKTNGQEDGILSLQVMIAGTIREAMRMSDGGVVINELSQDMDFRVESNGNANMLFVDGGNDRVLIGGTNATFGELGITGASNGNAKIDMYQSCGSSVRGKAELFFSTDSSSDHESMASIVMQQPSGDQAARKGEMLLNVSDNGGPATALTVANNGVVSGNLNDTSDENLKKNITDLGASTDLIKALKPRQFDWKQTSAGSNIAGFVAQEVASVIPTAVVGNDYIATTYYIETDDIPEGYAIGDIKDHGDKGKALNTTAILAHAVKTIQELEARITTLEG